jgi:hypothetical protein
VPAGTPYLIGAESIKVSPQILAQLQDIVISLVKSHGKDLTVRINSGFNKAEIIVNADYRISKAG